MNELKCISLWQPYASAVALGLKRIETRASTTRHRGPLGIYATLRMHSEQRRVFEEVLLANEDKRVRALLAKAGWLQYEALPFGRLIAIVDVIDSRPVSHVDRLASGPLEFLLGDYTRGRFAWMLANARKLTKPLTVSGKQGFFFIRQRQPFL